MRFALLPVLLIVAVVLKVLGVLAAVRLVAGVRSPAVMRVM